MLYSLMIFPFLERKEVLYVDEMCFEISMDGKNYQIWKQKKEYEGFCKGITSVMIGLTIEGIIKYEVKVGIFDH